MKSVPVAEIERVIDWLEEEHKKSKDESQRAKTYMMEGFHLGKVNAYYNTIRVLKELLP